MTRSKTERKIYTTRQEVKPCLPDGFYALQEKGGEK